MSDGKSIEITITSPIIPSEDETEKEEPDEEEETQEEDKPILDFDKINDYILCHDLPEAITGDITKFEGVSEEERKLDPSLNIVPVLAFNEDRSRFVALGVMPSLKPAIERVIEEFKNTGVDGKYFITIAQSYCMEDAEMAKATGGMGGGMY